MLWAPARGPCLQVVALLKDQAGVLTHGWPIVSVVATREPITGRL